jgi:ribulose-bisphosphate carboxylase small chain
MKVTQGQFSFLPELSDEQIEAQLKYALSNGWSIMVEYTDDPNPRNNLWDMWSTPLFDLQEDEAEVALREIRACCEAHSHLYVKVVAYDRSLGRQTSAMSFIVNRPEYEPGFRLERQESHDRVIRYSLHSYATEAPVGQRYGSEGQGLPTGGGKPASTNGKGGDE